MDLSTGEKWVKINSDDDDEEGFIRAKAIYDNNGDVDAAAAAVDGNNNGVGKLKVESAVMDSSGALTIVENNDSTDDSDADATKNDANNNKSNNYGKDYAMMHRVMSQIDPEELERFGGLPALPSTDGNSTKRKEQLTEAGREIFESRMEELWKNRQEELAKAQESVADLPSMLKDRIRMITEYLDDVEGSLKDVLLEKKKKKEEEGDDDDDDGIVYANDIISALRDLEFQLSDVDMARDFHTLGGWPYLVSLLDNGVHSTTVAVADADAVVDKEEEEAISILIDEIQALAAMTIGTAVSNLGEFNGWALENVEMTLANILNSESTSDDDETTTTAQQQTTPTLTSSALSLLVTSFENELTLRSTQMNGGSMAVIQSYSNAKYKSRATYKLRAIYALGSLLRGNPTAQQSFISMNGAHVLVRDVLGTLSHVRGPLAGNDKVLTRLDYKFGSKVLALGEDVVMDVVLHEDEYVKTGDNDDESTSSEETVEGVLTANQLVAAFTNERWCDLSLRMLAPPSEIIGATASRGMKERAMSAVRALAPGCRANDESWGLEEVKQVRSEWNREGSDDGLESVYRRELLDLVDGVLDVLQ